jgi:hypothetical protein
MGSFIVPAIMLDGLLRVSVPDQAPEIPRLLAVPTTIRRLDLYVPGNDCALAADGAPIDLCSVPAGRDRDDARAVASYGDGRVVAQIEGLRSKIVGSLTEDGEFVPAAPRGAVALASAG